MDEKEAWTWLGDRWINPVESKIAIYDATNLRSFSFGVYITELDPKIHLFGLCYAISLLKDKGLYPDSALMMRSKILTELKAKNHYYLFPLTIEGQAQRREFCYQQEKLCV